MNQADQMNPFRERLSALADSELDPTEAQSVIDGLASSAPDRAFWADLHAVGDLLRSDEMGERGSSEEFMRLFSARLEAEPVVLAPRVTAPASNRSWLRFGLPGASIAAGIAMVLWMAIPQMTKPDAEVADARAPVPAQPTVVVSPAPVAAMPAAVQMDPEQVGEYLTAHQGSVQAASLTIIPSKAEARQ